MFRLSTNKGLTISKKYFSISARTNKDYSCKLLVVGGGTGGCATAAKFSRQLKKHELIILEPATEHYYQPLFTLVGGGISNLSQTSKPMSNVLPSNSTWLQDKAISIEPKKNCVKTAKGDTIQYDFMLVAVGLQLNYSQIPGLVEALSIPDSGVCSNYSPDFVTRTFPAMQKVESGNLIFTYPDGPVKCPGAPQKICYLTDHYMRKEGKRSKVNIIYNTALPVIFGVKEYANCLWDVCKRRDIKVNLRTNLIRIEPSQNEATFQNLDNPEKKFTTKYAMLHVPPPMGTPDVLKNCKELVNEAGFVDVNPQILQSVRFSNVFAIGDCSSSPNSKTAAAAAAQCYVVYDNLYNLMEGKTIPTKSLYDGYASCPLVTGYNKCILAEFDYNLEPLETFPFRQDKELTSMYYLKKMFMPALYWNLMTKGLWNGPKAMRNMLHMKIF